VAETAGVSAQTSGWERPNGTFVVVQRYANLLQIVLALRSSGSFPGCLNRGQQQGNQNAMIAITTNSSTRVKPRGDRRMPIVDV